MEWNSMSMSIKEATICSYLSLQRKMDILQAFETELKPLKVNNDQEFIDLPVRKKLLELSKRLYKVKTRADGSTDLYKARLKVTHKHMELKMWWPFLLIAMSMQYRLKLN